MHLWFRFGNQLTDVLLAAVLYRDAACVLAAPEIYVGFTTDRADRPAFSRNTPQPNFAASSRKEPSSIAPLRPSSRPLATAD